VQGGRRDRQETPRASFIPAQGNALGSSAQNPISAESAIHPSSYQPPASHSASVPNVSFMELYEAGRWPATEYLWDDEPRALPWAGMKQAFGLSRDHPPGEHPLHRNPFSYPRGYEFCHRGTLEHSGRNCRTDGSGVTLRTCWSANQQVGLWEMLVDYDRSNSPLL